MTKKYTLKVKGKAIPVTQEIYKEYYRIHDRQQYLDKLAKQKNIYLEFCEEKGIPIEYEIYKQNKKADEELLQHEEDIQKLRKAFDMLDETERKIIDVYYYKGLNTAESARLLHMKNTTLHNHKIKILKKLKKIMQEME